MSEGKQHAEDLGSSVGYAVASDQWRFVRKHGDIDQERFLELERMMSAKRHMKCGLLLMAVWFASGLVLGVIIGQLLSSA